MRWLTVFLLVLAPSTASAWQINGVRLTGARGSQVGPEICSDGVGGAFVSWADFRDDIAPHHFGSDLYLQHVTATGQLALGWPPDGLAIATGPGVQGNTWRMVPDGSGGVLIAFGDTGLDFGDLYLQRITAAGVVAPGWPAGGVPIAVAPGQQSDAELASDGAGGAFVGWQDGVELPDVRARYTHVLGSGQVAPGWPANGRPFEPTSLLVGRPLLLPTEVGGFFACWGASDEPTLATARVLAQRFTADGLADPTWPAGGVVACVDRPFSRGPVAGLVSDGAGGFYTVLLDFRNSDPATQDETDVYAQHVLGDGTVASGWPADALVVSALPGVTQQDPTLCEDGRGGVYIAWDDYRVGYAQVFGVRLGPDGQRQPGWPADGRLLSNAFAYQLSPRLAWDGMSGAYLAWMNAEAVGYRSYVQHLTSSGAPAPGWLADGVPVATPTWYQYVPVIVGDGSGGAIVAWEDGRTPPSTDIYAQRYVGDGVVAARVSLVSAEATADEVRVRWQVSGESRASAERREGAGEWRVQAQLDADGGGYMSVVDREVTPGARYDYRLVFPNGAHGGETSLEVPVRLTLALEGARPNPASGALWLAFTLPDASPARLELFDLAGRRLVARDVGAAGRHVVRMDEGTLSPGLYWAALTQGARTLRTRVAMVR